MDSKSDYVNSILQARNLKPKSAYFVSTYMLLVSETHKVSLINYFEGFTKLSSILLVLNNYTKKSREMFLSLLVTDILSFLWDS